MGDWIWTYVLGLYLSHANQGPQTRVFAGRDGAAK
jgi:hypothetical protein